MKPRRTHPSAIWSSRPYCALEGEVAGHWSPLVSFLWVRDLASLMIW